jgi:hypothetical protein
MAAGCARRAGSNSSRRTRAASLRASRRTWRPLSDVHIQIRTAAAWRAANRSPLLRTLVDLLPRATEPGSDDVGTPRPARSRPERERRG